jgi:nucleotide-binding universal stress UspA family protein
MTTEALGSKSCSSSARRILVGVDGSAPSVKALDWAVRQAELTGSTIEVFMAWQWPNTYGWNVPLAFELDPAANARKVVDGLVTDTETTHPDIPIVTKLERGHPAPLLVKESKGADMLVVGNRGHGEFVGMLLGSVSEYCATKAHCPVMIYRETD